MLLINVLFDVSFKVCYSCELLMSNMMCHSMYHLMCVINVSYIMSYVMCHYIKVVCLLSIMLKTWLLRDWLHVAGNMSNKSFGHIK